MYEVNPTTRHMKLERKNIEYYSSPKHYKMLSGVKVVKEHHDSEETNVRAIDGQTGKFDLKLGNLIVGTLTYEMGKWKFAYSPEFKGQNKYNPIANFPVLDRPYVSDNLWPFFMSRLPGSAQLSESSEKDDIITLLKKYGKHVITNPFVLA